MGSLFRSPAPATVAAPPQAAEPPPRPRAIRQPQQDDPSIVNAALRARNRRRRGFRSTILTDDAIGGGNLTGSSGVTLGA